MNKYRAKKVKTADGTFDSKAELAHWHVLKLREKSGEIFNLRRQVRYPLVVRNVKVCDYVADFEYDEGKRVRGGLITDLTRCVVDVKGFKTPVYNLKKRLMLAVHGIKIVEVKAGRK